MGMFLMSRPSRGFPSQKQSATYSDSALTKRSGSKLRFCHAAMLAQLPLAMFRAGVYALDWGLRI